MPINVVLIKCNVHDFALNIKKENLMPLNNVAFNWHYFFIAITFCSSGPLTKTMTLIVPLTETKKIMTHY